MIENDKQLEVTIKALNNFKESQGSFGDDALGKIMEEATQSTIDELEEEIRVYCESKNYKDTYKIVMMDISSVDISPENLPPQKQFKDDNRTI